ncbi:1894_t:CDS:2 [Entrophospora sp. SA101]|nr:1894_t:CDS:2 [Entrophospora sp. SA101]
MPPSSQQQLQKHSPHSSPTHSYAQPAMVNPNQRLSSVKSRKVALLIGCSSLVAAFSKGAPGCVADAAKMAAAKSMGIQGEFGYTVTAKELAKGYTPGGPAVKVTVGSAKSSFKGILVYAVDAKNNHVGTFAKPANLQFQANCPGDNGSGTLTHMAGVGKIMFMATFVSGGPKSPAPGFQAAKSIPYAELAAAPGKTPAATDTAAPPTNTNTTPSPPAGSTPSPPAGSTPSPTTANQPSGGISISQYSSFGALVLANVVAAFILL